MNPTSPLGVSVVICCYNSASRLPKTLNHLLKQDAPADLPWEVIIVDNACTDNTAQVACSCWLDDAPVPLRVISEPKPGLSHARKRGFQEARYDLVSFVDDDNWLNPHYIRLVADIMAIHPELGACGGRTEAVFETEPPFWFERFKHHFAVGTQAEKSGDITIMPGHLWGAGLTIRKKAWEQLIAEGFQSILSGRRGTSLTSGEDYEICYALRLAGWRLWYEPDLFLQHFMPAGRINWDYMRRLNRGHGITRVGIEPYEFALNGSSQRLVRIAGRIWVWQAIKTTGKLLLWHGWDWIHSLWRNTEGDLRILSAEYQFGRLVEILRKRSDYDRSVSTVWSAKYCRKPVNTDE